VFSRTFRVPLVRVKHFSRVGVTETDLDNVEDIYPKYGDSRKITSYIAHYDQPSSCLVLFFAETEEALDEIASLPDAEETPDGPTSE